MKYGHMKQMEELRKSKINNALSLIYFMSRPFRSKANLMGRRTGLLVCTVDHEVPQFLGSGDKFHEVHGSFSFIHSSSERNLKNGSASASMRKALLCANACRAALSLRRSQSNW